MKLKVSKELIIEALQRVQAVVSPRSTLPVLSNILFKAEGEKLWLTATDLELSVRASSAAEIAKAGGTTLPAKRAFSVFREMSGPEIEIETDDHDVTTIRSGSAVFRLNGMSDEEFPPLPEFEAGRSYVIEQKRLKTMLQRTGYAVSTEESRPALNGVLLSFKDDKLTVVATDGRRLALVEQELEFTKESEGDMILPTKTMVELVRSLKDEGTLKIRATKNQIAFESEDAVIMSKLIDHTYPNFRQVIPSECEERIPIERELLLNAVRRVAVLTSEQSNSVKCTFGKNRLEILVTTPEIGEARETVPIKYAGKEIIISFNPEFMMDPLKNLVADEVYIELSNGMSPGMIKSDEPFLYVLMPVHIS